MTELPDAHVFETGHRCFKVRPGVVAVRHDEGFEPRNVTAWAVMYQFPPGVTEPDAALRDSEPTLRKLFPEQAADTLARSHWAPPGTSVHITFAPGVQGVFDYTVTVFTDEGPVEGAGESAPKIIVDP